MFKIFRTSIFTKILYFTFSLVFLLLGFLLLFFSKINNWGIIFISFFSIIAAFFFLFIAFNRKVIIETNNLTCINYFKKKTIKINEIKGFRIDTKYLKLEHISNKKLNLTIEDITSFKDFDNIISWATENFKDLDFIELQIEEQRLLNDSSLGETKEKRNLLIKKSNKFSVIYNLVGIISSLGSIFFDNYLSFFVLLILPLIGLFLICYFDLIKFVSNSKNSFYGSIIYVFLLASILLIVKTTDCNLVCYDKIWNPMLISSALIFLVLFLNDYNKSFNFLYGQLLLMFFAALLYSFGFIKGINSVLDYSTEKNYNVKVIDQHISNGKSDSYYLTLDIWKFQNKTQDIRVSESLYNEIKSGDFVSVNLKKGYFDIPWFVISEKK